MVWGIVSRKPEIADGIQTGRETLLLDRSQASRPSGKAPGGPAPTVRAYLDIIAARRG